MPGGPAPGAYAPLFSPGPGQGARPPPVYGSPPPMGYPMGGRSQFGRDEMDFEDEDEEDREPGPSNEKRVVNGKPLLVNWEIK